MNKVGLAHRIANYLIAGIASGAILYGVYGSAMNDGGLVWGTLIGISAALLLVLYDRNEWMRKSISSSESRTDVQMNEDQGAERRDVEGGMTEQIEGKIGPMSVYVSSTDMETARETFDYVWEEKIVDKSEEMREFQQESADSDEPTRTYN